MPKRREPTYAQEIPKRKAKSLLFELGQVVATPAALLHLETHAVLPAALLSRHQHGDWGTVDGEDAKVNDAAVQSGARIVSSFCVEYVIVWVVTEAEGDDGNRTSTCLLLPEEY
jgi:hypothetical protein